MICGAARRGGWRRLAAGGSVQLAAPAASPRLLPASTHLHYRYGQRRVGAHASYEAVCGVVKHNFSSRFWGLRALIRPPEVFVGRGWEPPVCVCTQRGRGGRWTMVWAWRTREVCLAAICGVQRPPAHETSKLKLPPPPPCSNARRPDQAPCDTQICIQGAQGTCGACWPEADRHGPGCGPAPGAAGLSARRSGVGWVLGVDRQSRSRCAGAVNQRRS